MPESKLRMLSIPPQSCPGISEEWTLPWMRPAETEKKKQNSGK